MSDSAIFIGSGAGGADPQQLELSRANRHGLIAGATGTGKTVTLQGLIEGFCLAGVPTFVADVKGDLAGLGMPGSATSKTHEPFRARAAVHAAPAGTGADGDGDRSRTSRSSITAAAGKREDLSARSSSRSPPSQRSTAARS